MCCRAQGSCAQFMIFESSTTNVVCSGTAGCFAAKILLPQNGDVSSSDENAVLCSGQNSCLYSTKQNLTQNSIVYCGGSFSCAHSRGINNAKKIYCHGYNSCAYAKLNGISEIVATGYDALFGATIKSNGVGEMTIYLLTADSGNSLTIECNDGDLCNIECGINGACSSSSTILSCEEGSKCNVVCVSSFDDYINCPTMEPTPMTLAPTC